MIKILIIALIIGVIYMFLKVTGFAENKRFELDNLIYKRAQQAAESVN